MADQKINLSELSIDELLKIYTNAGAEYAVYAANSSQGDYYAEKVGDKKATFDEIEKEIKSRLK